MNKIEGRLHKVIMSVPTIDDDGGNEYEDYKALTRETARVCVDLMREAWRDGHRSAMGVGENQEFDDFLKEKL